VDDIRRTRETVRYAPIDRREDNMSTLMYY